MNSGEGSFYGSVSQTPTTDDLRTLQKQRYEEDELEKIIAEERPRQANLDELLKAKEMVADSPSGVRKANPDIVKEVILPKIGGTLTGDGVKAFRQDDVDKVLKDAMKQKNNNNNNRRQSSSIVRPCFLVILTTVFASLFIIIVLMFAIFPLVFSTSLQVRRRLMFVGWIRLVPEMITNPAALGLLCSNYTVITESDIALAAWYIPPKGQPCGTEKPFTAKRPTVLYVPTIGETRANPETIALLKIISQDLCYHVVVFDYKGTADSGNGLPSASSIFSDTILVYKWLIASMSDVGNVNDIIIWANSWGAPIALKLIVAIGVNITYRPHRLILQSPVEMTATAATTGLAFNKFWRWTPYFDQVFVEPLLHHQATNLDSVKTLSENVIPINTLVIHAEDDGIIDFGQGLRIFEALRRPPNKQNPLFVFYNISLEERVGHEVHRALKFVSTIQSFMDNKTIETTTSWSSFPTEETTHSMENSSKEHYESTMEWTSKTTS